jgi:hypothetical protein
MDIKVLVAAHKKYRMPDDGMYMPVHVGKACNHSEIGFISDDTGDNISAKNSNYCELTGLYWAWKNLKADYIGLAHYRRHFVSGKGRDKWAAILSEKKAEEILTKVDIILPRKRKYFIESVYSHYAHSHKPEPLDIAIAIIKKDFPDYENACDKVMHCTSAHLFNMFIMKRDKLYTYCEWLFAILFELEKQVDISEYSAFEARVFGRISELLLDVWLEKNGYEYAEMPVCLMEKQNWIHKGGLFLLRKLKIVKTNERY